MQRILNQYCVMMAYRETFQKVRKFTDAVNIKYNLHPSDRRFTWDATVSRLLLNVS